MMHYTPQAFGERSEALVETSLRERGFEIVTCNFFAKKLGEIDIVAKKEGVYHFVEVKSTQYGSFEPLYNVTPAKLRKMIRSATYYLQKYHLDAPFSLDIALCYGEQIEFLENVTL